MIATFYIPLRLYLLGKLKSSESTRQNVRPPSQGEQNQDENMDNGVHPLLAKVQSFMGVKQSQKDFYAYIFKISSPVIVAWASSFLAGITNTVI